MSTLHIRPGMDVYSAYQDQYIGSVVRVWRRDDRSGSAPQRGAAGDQTGSSPEYALGAARSNPNLIHEEGHDVDPTWVVGTQQPVIYSAMRLKPRRAGLFGEQPNV